MNGWRVIAHISLKGDVLPPVERFAPLNERILHPVIFVYPDRLPSNLNYLLKYLIRQPAKGRYIGLIPGKQKPPFRFD